MFLRALDLHWALGKNKKEKKKGKLKSDVVMSTCDLNFLFGVLGKKKKEKKSGVVSQCQEICPSHHFFHLVKL